MEENIITKPFVDRPWTAFIVQTFLTTFSQYLFGALGGYLGLVFLWDHNRTDFPIFEFFIGCFVGGIVGLIVGWRAGLKILRKYFVQLTSVTAIMIFSSLIGCALYLLFFVLYFPFFR